MKRVGVGNGQEELLSKRPKPHSQVTDIPPHVWLDYIFPRLPIVTNLQFQNVNKFFRQFLSLNDNLWFEVNWTRYSSQPLNVVFAAQKWAMLNSLVSGQCPFCGSKTYNFFAIIPAYICGRCISSHPWLTTLSETQAVTQFHISRYEAKCILNNCHGFSASNPHLDRESAYRQWSTHMRYLKREIALGVYSLYGGKEAWLQHWHSKEKFANKRREQSTRMIKKAVVLDITTLP